MYHIAPDLYLLRGFPKYGINIYWMGGVLVDAGTRFARGRILRQLRERPVTAHALTHAHPDHQGASHAVCETLNIPLWCGAKEVTAMESGNLAPQFPKPSPFILPFQLRYWAGPAHPVDRVLREGDEVGGFTVIETPGHAPGHISFWRESDRTLVLGDVLFNSNPLGQVGLREPPAIFTLDPALNRDSARKVAELRPKLICFGHGPPLKESQKLVEFVSQLS